MKNWINITIAGLALIICSGCSDSFLVFKNGQGYFLTSDSKGKYTMLCASGDLEKVLADTSLSREMKNDLYKYNCSDERSAEKIGDVYATMTPEQRKDIKTAFIKNGYEINHGTECCGQQ